MLIRLNMYQSSIYFAPKARRNEPGPVQVGAISKAQGVNVFYSTVPEKNPKFEPRWRAMGDVLRFFIRSVANHQKNIEGHLGEKNGKNLKMPTKLRGTL